MQFIWARVTRCTIHQHHNPHVHYTLGCLNMKTVHEKWTNRNMLVMLQEHSLRCSQLTTQGQQRMSWSIKCNERRVKLIITTTSNGEHWALCLCVSVFVLVRSYVIWTRKRRMPDAPVPARVYYVYTCSTHSELNNQQMCVPKSTCFCDGKQKGRWRR